MNKQWKIAGINFDFRHMDHLLTFAHATENVEVCGVWHSDLNEVEAAVSACSIPRECVFERWETCLEKAKPDVVLLCPATRDHCLWVERIAEAGCHVLMEKPFAANLAQADRMIAAMAVADRQLAVNWPLAWYPPHVTANRLLREGAIGELQEVHFYDGNRGPILDRTQAHPAEPTLEEKRAHWYYDPDGGGSLLDYLGYGVVLATWFWQGRAPSEVATMAGGNPELAVDEQSVTMARYGNWVSTFQTRWGTLTDPWEFQTQPKCGFVLKGTEGTIGHFDYEDQIRLANHECPQGRILPVDVATFPFRNPVEYFINCLEHNQSIEGPLSIEYNRIGQQIVDTAVKSLKERCTVNLIK